jgi:hypothetical protein
VFSGATVEDISCPATNLCVAFGQSVGFFPSPPTYVSQDPTKAGSWQRRSGPRSANVLACSTHVCVAIEVHYGLGITAKVLQDPSDPRSRWTSTPLGAYGRPTGVTCAEPAACMITMSSGAILTSTNLTVTKPTWTRTIIYGPYSPAIQLSYRYAVNDPICFSTNLCYAEDAGNDLLVSTDPFGGAPTSWQKIHIPHARGESAQGLPLSCPTAQVCYVLVGRRVLQAKISTG